MFIRVERPWRRLRGDKGFTLAELLVAALFGLVVIATLYGFFREQLFQLLAQETKTATLEDARGALDMMVHELRNAGSWGTGTVPVTGSGTPCARVVTATATSINIQADLDGNGICSTATAGEDVTYDLGSATSTCPGSIIRRNSNCLIPNVVLPTGSLFTYYDSSNTQLSASPTVTSIKRVQVTFSVQVSEPTPEGKAAGRNITSTLTSSAEFRN